MCQRPTLTNHQGYSSKTNQRLSKIRLRNRVHFDTDNSSINIAAETDDEFYNIKKNILINEDYERYINIEKLNELKRINRETKPFEHVALSIRKGLKLNSIELHIWMKKNFLNLKDDEQEEILKYFKRRNYFRLFLICSFPIYFV